MEFEDAGETVNGERCMVHDIGGGIHGNKIHTQNN